MKIFLEAYREWIRDRAKGMAPALAYYELLCSAPLISFILIFSDRILGRSVVENEIIPLLKYSFSPQMTKVIIFLIPRDISLEEAEKQTFPLLAALLFLWAGREYFGQIKETIENIWNKRRGKVGFKWRAMDVVEDLKVAGIAVFIMLVFLFLRLLFPVFPVQGGNDELLFQVGRLIAQFILIFSLRMFYFVYIPPVNVNWKNVVAGAALGALLLILGRAVMDAHYHEREDAGVAESIIMVLLWLYYGNLTFIYSAEFAKVCVAKKQNLDIQQLKFD